MFINPFTGGRLTESYLDLSRDGYFTSADMPEVEGQRPVASGIGTDSATQGVKTGSDSVASSGEGGESDNIKKNNSRGVVRSSWRELRRP